MLFDQSDVLSFRRGSGDRGRKIEDIERFVNGALRFIAFAMAILCRFALLVMGLAVVVE